MDDPEQLTGLISDGAVVLRGLDSAILGHTGEGLLVYGHHGLLTSLEKGGMDAEGAHEWIDYNVLPLQVQGAGFVLCYEIPQLS